MNESVTGDELRTATLAAFIGYLLVVVAIGFYAARFSSTGIREFFIGGRRLGRFVVAFSAVVSGRSAWLLLGFAGTAYTRGASAVWAAVGYIVVECALFLTYAVRLRRYSERYDCITVPDFFAARFGDRSGWLRVLLTSVILVFLVTYVAAQFTGGGKTLAATFDITMEEGAFLTAGIVLAYTVLGGFLAVSLTDLVQAVVMLVSLIVVPVVGIIALGGPGELFDRLALADAALVDPLAISAGALIGFVGIGLGSPGQPHIISRYLSIEDPKELRSAAVIGTSLNVLLALGALFVGLVGRALFATETALPGGDPERVFLVLAADQLHPVLFGVVVASVFAAIMSTADSQILVIASSVVRDLFQQVFRRGATVSDRSLVWLSRTVVVLAVGVALVLGLMAEKQLFWLVLLAWGGLGAAIGPPSILALYWRETTRAGVIAGILAGAITTMVWDQTGAFDNFYELVPGFIASAFATWLVSFATKPPDDVADAFDAMT